MALDEIIYGITVNEEEKKAEGRILEYSQYFDFWEEKSWERKTEEKQRVKWKDNHKGVDSPGSQVKKGAQRWFLKFLEIIHQVK